MKIRLDINQYKIISEFLKKDISEQGDTNSEPSKGTSPTQSGGKGYPQVGKWESGIARGPGNQIGITKWSDVVGNNLKRGKANQLKENIDLKDYLIKLYEQNDNTKNYDVYDAPTPNAWGMNKLYLPKGSTVSYFDGNEDLMSIFDKYKGTKNDYLVVTSKDQLPPIKIGTVKSFTVPIGFENIYETFVMNLGHDNKSGKKFFYWYDVTTDYNNDDDRWYVHTNYIVTEGKTGDEIDLKNIIFKENEYLKEWEIAANYQGVPRPTPPIPACEVDSYRNLQVMEIRDGKTYVYNKYCETTYKKNFWKQSVPDQPIWWYYSSPLHKKHKYGFGEVNTDLTILGRKNEVQRRYEIEDDLWLHANYNTTLKRTKDFEKHLSPQGYDVPPGYIPNETYDVMMDKINKIREEIKILEGKKDQVIIDRSLELGYQPNLDTEYDELIKQKYQEIEDLKNRNYTKQFSYGLTYEEQMLYNAKLQEINEKYDPLINQALANHSIAMNNLSKERQSYFDMINKRVGPRDNLNPPKINPFETFEFKNYIKLKDQKNASIEFLNMTFGRDDWWNNSSCFGWQFDRFMENYGTAFAIIGNLAIIMFSGGIAFVLESSAIAAARVIGIQILRSGAVRAMAAPVADAAFNATLGAHFASKKDWYSVMISLICTVVPFVSAGKSIGRHSVQEATLLRNKILATDMTDAAQVQTLLRSLNETDRYMLRNSMLLPVNLIKQDYDLIYKLALSGLAGAGLKVEASTFFTWLPPLLKIIGTEAGPPLLTQFALKYTGLYNQIKPSATAAELSQIREYVEELIKEKNIVTVIGSMDHVVENSEKINNVEDMKKIVQEGVLIYNSPTDEQRKQIAIKMGLPERWFTNPEEFKKDRKIYLLKLAELQNTTNINNTTPTPTPTPTPNDDINKTNDQSSNLNNVELK